MHKNPLPIAKKKSTHVLCFLPQAEQPQQPSATGCRGAGPTQAGKAAPDPARDPHSNHSTHTKHKPVAYPTPPRLPLPRLRTLRSLLRTSAHRGSGFQLQVGNSFYTNRNSGTEHQWQDMVGKQAQILSLSPDECWMLPKNVASTWYDNFNKGWYSRSKLTCRRES